MSTAYDELLKQVQSLKAENRHLKHELQDNSSHLSVLEDEANSMKDVFSQLHSTIGEDSQSNSNIGDITSTYPDYQSPPSKFNMTANRDDNQVDQNSNSSNDETMSEQNWAHLQTTNPFRNSDSHLAASKSSLSEPEKPSEKERGSVREEGGGRKTEHSPSASPVSTKRRQADQNMYTVLQDLDKERSVILQEIENEDSHRKWYQDQMESINNKMESLPPQSEGTFNVQADLARRQLEFEASRLGDMAMESLGTAETAALRHEGRLQRIQILETQMVRLQHRHQQQYESEKRDSGTCDHLERDENGIVVTDAATNTAEPQHNVYVAGPVVEGDSPLPLPLPGLADQGDLYTTGTQTPDQYTQELFRNLDGAACQLPNHNITALYHGGWPLTGGVGEGGLSALPIPQDTASVMSFHSSNVTSSSASLNHRITHQHLGAKVEMVYSLLSMLGTHDKDDMSRTLLAMSSSQDSCIAMRQSGCLPLLIQLLHGSDKDSGLLGNTRGSKAARDRAAAALHNIVHSHPDDKRGRREARVLRLLEQIRAHCDHLQELVAEESGEEGHRSRHGSGLSDMDHHPGPAIAALMKLSFDEEHRHAICTLGGLQAIAELLQLDHEINGNTVEQYNITMRRYACMALTNLTFGDGTNKALLCSMKCAMRALVGQLRSANEDLRQVAASVVRNLSWRADLASKKTLREVQSVTALTTAAMEVKKESTLKSILSALWNLSAHCSENKADICAVAGALEFLVGILSYKSPSKTTSIIENGGGILRNVSSHIAVREDYRKILRMHGCLQLLLKHLRSPSLTIVSNACGTLWNLSARCPEDQKALWEKGAVNMLRNLVHSKHKMISMGSAAALKNLLSARPALHNLEDNVFSRPNMPGLHVRKQRHLVEELDSQNLSETCENLESPQGSPTEHRKHDLQPKNKYIFHGDNAAVYQQGLDHDPRRPLMRGNMLNRSLGSSDSAPDNRMQSPQRSVSRSGSQDSVGSTHSDISHDRIVNSMLSRSKLLQDRASRGLDRSRSRDHSAGKTSSNELCSEHNRSGSGPNSRIIQAMQEVALAAGLESGGSNLKEGLKGDAQSADNTPGSTRKQQLPSQQQAGVDRGRIPVFRGHRPNNSLNQCMDNLHLNMPEPEQDQPINYSIKYSEAPPCSRNQVVTQSGARLNNQVTPSHGSAFVKPIVTLHNYVGGPGGSGRRHPVSSDAEMMPPPPPPLTAQSNTNTKTSSLSAKPRSAQQTKPRNHQQYSDQYAVTDLDSGDQPTNFSQIYAEGDDVEEPVNYSTRYSQAEVGRTYSDMHDLDDDTTRTFYTEGTPLNYMSTATSMSDLSNKGHTPKSDADANTSGIARQQADNNKSKVASTASATRTQQQQEALNLSVKVAAESEQMSMTGSQSTDRNTTSTVVAQANNVSEMHSTNMQNNNASSKGSPESNNDRSNPSLPPSLYSYNDNSTGTSSPSEKPHQYCEEGTPTCFSRVSSLSSLHSNDAQDQSSASPQSSSTGGNKHDTVLPSIDENDSLHIDPNDITLKPPQADDSFQSSANTSLSHTPGGTSQSKTVTFDENNQVQETPLMFSRCSSLGSLSSFEAHSVHSSVVSEYSRRASEVVSPSELPDSPSDTMPNSPSHRKSPVKFGADMPNNVVQQMRANDVNSLAQQQQQQQRAHKPSPQRKLFDDGPQVFADEGSPGVDFSCATSLSALTIDDEPYIQKDQNLPTLAREVCEDSQGDSTSLSSNEHFMAVEKSLNETVVEKEKPKSAAAVDDDDDDLSFSEGEEGEDEKLLLAECISLAMPTKSSKKVKKSSSDGFLKNKAEEPSKSVPISQGSCLLSRLPASRSMGSMSQPVYTQSNRSQATHGEETPSGYDTPMKFATEDTPLNFSAAGSLSDLSLDSHKAGDGASCPDKADILANQQAIQEEEDSDDLSSLSGGDEDLLSEAIESAMPKSKKKTPEKMDRVAEGSDSKDSFRFQTPSFKKPLPVSRPPPQQLPAASSSHRPCMDADGDDYVTTYAVEGTPINFSRRASLSDVTPESEPREENGNYQCPETAKADPPPSKSQLKTPLKSHMPKYSDQAGVGSDSPKVFGIEGTPVSFSRNDSLSSLSCDEDDLPSEKLPKSNLPISKAKSSASPKQVETQSPAMSRLKTPSKVHKPVYGPNCTSTPLTKQAGLNTFRHPAQQHTQDQMRSFAVEGTPADCLSRNSPLSSLNSSDEMPEEVKLYQEPVEHHQLQQQTMLEQNSTFKVEDTPAVFSGNSSLSSLSLESLTFDTTPAESALLEECINAAMPKSKKKKACGSVGAEEQVRSGPSGSSSRAAPSPHGSTEKSKRKHESEMPKSYQPKNEEGPQAEKENQDNLQDKQDSRESGLLLKDKKEASNQALLSSGDSAVSSCGENAGQEQGATALPSDAAPSEIPHTDNRLVDSQEKSVTFFLDEGAEFERNLCLEAKICAEAIEKEKMDLSDTSDQSGGTFTICLGRADSTEHIARTARPMVDSKSSSDDIMKESFPEMTSSLLSNITTPDSEIPLPLDNSNIREESGSANDSGANFADFTLTDDNERDITQEDEKLLEENANIILSALSFNRELSSSVLEDDDLLLDNETISLVSNDYASDTASEVSVSVSCSSKTASEPASEGSTTTLSTLQSIPTVKGPRIVKPINRDGVKKLTESGPKPIRGKRRSLSAPRVTPSTVKTNSPASSGAPKTVKPVVPKRSASLGPQKTAVVSPNSRGPANKNGTPNSRPVNQVTGIKKSPPRSVQPPPKPSATGPTGKNSPKTGAGKNGAMPSPRGSSSSLSTMSQKSQPAAATQKSSPKTVKVNKIPPPSKLASPVKPATSSKLPTSAKSGVKSAERPAPPIKQGTFTKDEPTQNVPTISPPGSARSSVEVENSPRGSKADSPVVVQNVQSTDDGKSKLKGIPIPSSTEKTPSKVGLNKGPSGTSLNRLSSAAISAKSPTGGAVNKSLSGASLSKAGSNSSIKSLGNAPTKTSPRSSIPSVRSTTPTRTPGAKVTPPRNIQKSDSQSSIKKTPSPSLKSQTSQPRRNSSTSSVCSVQSVKEVPKKTVAPTPTSVTAPCSVGPKKPAVSKIAGLWRKDKKAEEIAVKADVPCSNVQPSESSKAPADMPAECGGSVQPKAQINVPESTIVIPKSSTYDKLSPETSEVACVAVAATTSDAVQVSKSSSVMSSQDKSIPDDVTTPVDPKTASWRHTYTLPAEETNVTSTSETTAAPDKAAPSKPSKSEGKSKGHKMSLSLWRRNTDSKDKKKEKEVTSGPSTPEDAPPTTQKKKGFSLWRKDPSSKNSSKIPNKGGLWSKKNSELSAADKSKTLPLNSKTPTEDSDKSIKSSTLPRQLNGSPSSVRAVSFQSSGSPLTSPTRNQPPAVAVPPFNYKPSGSSVSNNSEAKDIVAPLKGVAHATKTEMLMARRRQSYMNSVKSEGENETEDHGDGKAAPLVTTV